MITHLTENYPFDQSMNTHEFYKTHSFSLCFFKKYESTLIDIYLFRYSRINEQSLPLFKQEIEKNTYTFKYLCLNQTLSQSLVEEYFDIFIHNQNFIDLVSIPQLNKRILKKIFEHNKQPQNTNLRDMNKWYRLNKTLQLQRIPKSILIKHMADFDLQIALEHQQFPESLLYTIITNDENYSQDNISNFRYTAIKMFRYQKLSLQFIAHAFEYLENSPINLLRYTLKDEVVSMGQYFINLLLQNRFINKKELEIFYCI